MADLGFHKSTPKADINAAVEQAAMRELLAKCIRAETRLSHMTTARIMGAIPDGAATTRAYATIANMRDAGWIEERRGELHVTEKGYQIAGVSVPIWKAPVSPTA